jgi:uncharacterized protein
MLGQLHDDARDAGPRKGGSGAERLCAATHELKPVDAMIRFVVAPDGIVVPDLKRRLPGRGIWITATREALGTAIARKAFARGFKRDVRIAPDLLQTTEELMERAALQALAMAHKAGTVAIGFAKTDVALARARVRGLINAREAAPDGTNKLAATLQRREDGGEIAVIGSLASAQLDLALGRSNVIHAALLAGPESETFLARIARLDRFRAGPRLGSGSDPAPRPTGHNKNRGRAPAKARVAGERSADDKTAAEEVKDRDRN